MMVNTWFSVEEAIDGWRDVTWKKRKEDQHREAAEMEKQRSEDMEERVV